MAAYRAAMWVGKSLSLCWPGQSDGSGGSAPQGALMLLVALVNAVGHAASRRAPSARRRQPADSRRLKKSTGVPRGLQVLLHAAAGAAGLTFMFVHRLGDIMMFAMATPLLKDIGIDTKWRGVLSSFGTAWFHGRHRARRRLAGSPRV
jgi:hypothetical protein